MWMVKKFWYEVSMFVKLFNLKWNILNLNNLIAIWFYLFVVNPGIPLEVRLDFELSAYYFE